ncbi:Permease of the drug/metabolite transporter (DMT) superfamily [Hoeflea phototrophica DFL-43]|jgi:drug/metabolite transporter (DMT)-like permease|uniref:Permease of the drug/metabolite transporter (DMT) superfamily n=1 Tax=Hoeflea phototrophica (strain DSM 17068 / NCIMB 14078 / DFL-43) TaxID=411684 RepID=A9DDD5_HOEPD|nr:DMT family transporter [Hoeflea phototrophica]EDQ32050.1 Permease of the drug/metabolite transporter (DMT) superfamily [Hoeflea phototrophica DFL-43]
MTLDRIAPALFVLLWSTGWVAAKYASPHADPLTFLSIRFLLAAVLLAVITTFSRAIWPSTRAGWSHAVLSGVLLHGLYLGGVWWAISQGVPSSLSGLIAALQPLLTAVAAPFIVGERLTPSQKFGVLLGFAGLAVAIAPRLLELDPAMLHVALVPLIINVFAMVSVTAGTVYQKRYLQEGDLRAIASLQYVGGFLVVASLALLIEPLRVDWTLEFFLAMGWSVLGLSLVSVMLLLYLIRRGQVSRAASLTYLVPPAVAIESWIMFGEELTVPMIIGTVIVVIGVWLTNRKTRIVA